MPTHPCTHRPVPLTATVDAGAWRVTTYERGRCPDHPSHDSSLLASLPGRLRLAVTDAAVNPTVPDGDRLGHRACDVARGWLRTTADPLEALAQAALELHDVTVNPMRGPMAAVAVADLDPWTATASWVTMADCEVWTQALDGSWTRHGATDMLTESGRATQQRWKQEHPAGTPAQWWPVQESLSMDLDWVCPALGTRPVPSPRSGRAAGVHRVVVSTDGAELTVDRLTDLDRWMRRDLPGRDPGRHEHPHGDLTVLDAVFVGAPVG